MKRRISIILLCIMSFVIAFQRLAAQDEISATLEVLNPGVEVLNTNTVNWVKIKKESVVAIGDRIRTDKSGLARITFFANGVDTDILPNTEYEIQKIQGTNEAFNIQVSVIAGQTVQRLTKLLDSSSTYNVLTPGMELVARGTEFAVRVEANGRSGMLVSKGLVDAGAQDAIAKVPLGFGVRTTINEKPSDVVAATSFEALDAALDGCTVSLTTPDDTSLNVRLGPDVKFEQVGTISAQAISTFFGKTESGGWYRIAFRGSFGWILSSTAKVSSVCAGLRVFANNYGPEDKSSYSAVVEPTVVPESTAVPAPEATATPTG